MLINIFIDFFLSSINIHTILDFSELGVGASPRDGEGVSWRWAGGHGPRGPLGGECRASTSLHSPWAGPPTGSTPHDPLGQTRGPKGAPRALMGAPNQPLPPFTNPTLKKK